jgi:multidrug efflux pump subunit AcrA (membrane-fusion protein)
VLALSQAIGAGTGGMVVQLAADNRRAGLLPGGFASVRFALPPRDDVLVIPPSALLFGKAGPRVAVVNADHQVALKSVTIARDLGASVEIAAGLTSSDRIIESPPDGIADGAKVRPRVPAAPKPAPGKS